MCGIAGILDTAAVDPDLIRSMITRLHHRGPDHQDSYTLGPISLGYVRLSILDLSPLANQPMADQSGNFVCVYNGEVYNFKELRRELCDAGVSFASTSDTEVVVNLFAKQGVNGIRRLNGMFAVAIWSKKDRELWVFRDPLGIKPLYYRFVRGTLYFASEMKALLAVLDVIPNISTTGLMNFLTYGHAVAPDTIFDDIAKLPPGNFIHARPGQMSVNRYFEYPAPARSRPRPEREWIEEANQHLDAAIKRQMIADVPVGVFLSGGIDSGLVTAYMSRHAGALQTFTVTFPGKPAYDESRDAALIARAFGTRHNEIPLEEGDVLSTIETLVYHYDEPFGDAAGIPVYLLSRAARKHVKVVLCGEGGDEMFSGYRRYVAEQAYTFYKFLPAPVQKMGIAAASRFGTARRLNRILTTLPVTDPAERYARWLRIFEPHALRSLLSDDFAHAADDYDSVRCYRELFAKCSDAERLSALSYVDAQTWLPDTYLEKVDKATMAASLEARVPLLDLELVQFASRLPANMRIRGTKTKYLLRRVAESILPKSIVNKPKHGLSVPTASWFKNSLLGYVREILLDRKTQTRGFFRTGTVEQLIEQHCSGKYNFETQLWFLLIFELWMRNVVDRFRSCDVALVQI